MIATGGLLVLLNSTLYKEGLKSLADIYFLKNTPGKHSGNGNIILIGGPNYDRYEKTFSEDLLQF